VGEPHVAGRQAYSDSKLHDVLTAFAVARRWPMFSPTLLSLVGWQRRGEVWERRTIWTPRTALRFGSLSVMPPPQW
jgi:hypothetical protein